MFGMRNLEDRLIGQGSLKFKSEGERRIADFLESNSIKYHYEPPLLINSASGKPRIWYPDYYLPEFSAYIEYYGLVGRQNYDEGIKANPFSAVMKKKLYNISQAERKSGHFLHYIFDHLWPVRDENLHSLKQHLKFS